MRKDALQEKRVWAELTLHVEVSVPWDGYADTTGARGRGGQGRWPSAGNRVHRGEVAAVFLSADGR